MRISTNPEVEHVFDAYPVNIKPRMLELRDILLEAASEIGIDHLEETLKWGEPSYLTKYGSTVRMDWKQKEPDQYAVYFQCTSRLVPTFRAIFEGVFYFEGNRAILFGLDDPVPAEELKQCFAAALQYHRVKKTAHLGILHS